MGTLLLPPPPHLGSVINLSNGQDTAERDYNLILPSARAPVSLSCLLLQEPGADEEEEEDDDDDMDDDDDEPVRKNGICREGGRECESGKSCFMSVIDSAAV